MPVAIFKNFKHRTTHYIQDAKRGWTLRPTGSAAARRHAAGVLKHGNRYIFSWLYSIDPYQ